MSGPFDQPGPPEGTSPGLRWPAVLAIALVGTLALVVLIALAVHVFTIQTPPPHRTRCKDMLFRNYLGLRLYLNTYQDFFPLAWLESERPDDRLGKLSYWRLLIQEQAESGFNRIIDVEAHETAKMKFGTNKVSWSDSAKGYTKDYFGPSLLFRGFMDPATMEIDTTKHDSDANPCDRHAPYISVIGRDVPHSQRPVLTDVDASFPDPEITESDTKNRSLTTGHGKDLKQGWTLARATAPSDATSIDLFIGVGRSLRVYKETDADYGLLNSRFDFRHNGSVNVLFLDGHVAAVRETDEGKLRAVHDAWNKLDPWPGRAR